MSSNALQLLDHNSAVVQMHAPGKCSFKAGMLMHHIFYLFVFAVHMWIILLGWAWGAIDLFASFVKHAHVGITTAAVRTAIQWFASCNVSASQDPISIINQHLNKPGFWALDL